MVAGVVAAAAVVLLCAVGGGCALCCCGRINNSYQLAAKNGPDLTQQ